MIHAAIVPDRNIVWVDPSVPDLQIMVFHDKLQKPIHQVPALVFGDFVDALGVGANCEDALLKLSEQRAKRLGKGALLTFHPVTGFVLTTG
jgi:hypothetical protein